MYPPIEPQFFIYEYQRIKKKNKRVPRNRKRERKNVTISKEKKNRLKEN